jgi:hypothetical protein
VQLEVAHVNGAASQTRSVDRQLGHTVPAHEDPPPLHLDHEAVHGRRRVRRCTQDDVGHAPDFCLVRSEERKVNQA